VPRRGVIALRWSCTISYNPATQKSCNFRRRSDAREQGTGDCDSFQRRTFDRRSLLGQPPGRFGQDVGRGKSVSPGPYRLPGPAICMRVANKAPTSKGGAAHAAAGNTEPQRAFWETTITAATGPVRLGDHEFDGLLTMGGYVADDLAGRALARYLAAHFAQRYAGYKPSKPATIYGMRCVARAKQRDNAVPRPARRKFPVTRCASRIQPAKVRACSGTIRTAHGFVNEPITRRHVAVCRRRHGAADGFRS